MKIDPKLKRWSKFGLLRYPLTSLFILCQFYLCQSMLQFSKIYCSRFALWRKIYSTLLYSTRILPWLLVSQMITVARWPRFRPRSSKLALKNASSLGNFGPRNYWILKMRPIFSLNCIWRENHEGKTGPTVTYYFFAVIIIPILITGSLCYSIAYSNGGGGDLWRSPPPP